MSEPERELHIFWLSVSQQGGGVMKEDRMDVEPCYPLFSAELESAEALNSVMPLCVYFAHLLYMPIMIQC